MPELEERHFGYGRQAVTMEDCVRRVLDRIQEEREEGGELGLHEVELRLKHALTRPLSLADERDSTSG